MYWFAAEVRFRRGNSRNVCLPHTARYTERRIEVPSLFDKLTFVVLYASSSANHFQRIILAYTFGFFLGKIHSTQHFKVCFINIGRL